MQPLLLFVPYIYSFRFSSCFIDSTIPIVFNWCTVLRIVQMIQILRFLHYSQWSLVLGWLVRIATAIGLSGLLAPARSGIRKCFTNLFLFWRYLLINLTELFWNPYYLVVLGPFSFILSRRNRSIRVKINSMLRGILSRIDLFYGVLLWNFLEGIHYS